MGPHLFLRDLHLSGHYILINPRSDPNEYTVEPHGGILIVDKSELRRFALEILEEAEE